MKTARGKSVVCFSIFILAASARLSALDPQRSIAQYAQKNWQREQGLPNNSVRTLAETSDGQLLIGTANGLLKFDGTEFKSVPVDAADHNASYVIFSLLVARDGAVWIGTAYNGLAVQRDSQTRVYTTADGLASNTVQSLYEDDSGAIWVGTIAGTCRIAEAQVQCLSAEAEPAPLTWEDVVDDNSGGVLIAAQSKLFRWRRGTVSAIRLSGSGVGQIRALFRDRNKKIWAGTTTGLFRLHLRGNTAIFVRRDGIAGPVLGLADDRGGNLWISSFGHGLYRWNRTGIQQTTNPGHYIRVLFVDRGGSLWIGSRAHGLTRWTDGSFIQYGLSEGLSNSFATAVCEDARGKLWLASDGGLQRFLRGRITNDDALKHLLHKGIRAIMPGFNGDLWIGTVHDGLYHLDGHSLQHWGRRDGLPDASIRAMLLDAGGNLWVGFSPGGVIRFSGESINMKRAQTFFSGQRVYGLVELHRGTILVGTDSGLYRISIALAMKVRGSVPVFSLSKDSAGKVWVGLQRGGIGLFENGSLHLFSSEEGIQATNVDAVVDDRSGFLWLATSRSIIQVPRDQMLAAAEGSRSFVESASYGKLDGMQTAECRGEAQPAAWRASNGDLWFATSTGFVRRAAQTVTDGHTPKPVINEVKIDGRSVTGISELTLAPGTRELEMHFGAIWLKNPHQLQFRYKLVGFDRDWHTDTSSRVAHYAGLSPGHYRLLVRVRCGLGPWSLASATLAVRQQPYIYQTLWFQIIVIALAGATLWFWAYWYQGHVHGKLAAVLEERNRISREWHDSLMAGFAAISWQLEATRDRLLHSPNEARSSLELARDMVRHTQAEARRIIWDLRFNLGEQVTLSVALTNLCRRLSDATHVNVTTELQGAESPLSAVLSHNLFRIAQESLHNAIRHAQPNSIVVRLCYDAEFVTLCIKDDGCGFLRQKSRHIDESHFGILGMTERAHKLGGRLDVRSSPGAGTEVIATFSLRGQAA